MMTNFSENGHIHEFGFIYILRNLFVFVSGVRFLTLKVNPEGLPLKMKKTTNDIPMAKQEKRLRVENPGYSGWRIEL